MYRIGKRERWHLLQEWTQAGETAKILSLLEALSPSDVAHAIGHMPPDGIRQMLLALGPDAPEIVRKAPPTQAAEWLRLLPPANAAAAFQKLPTHRQTEVLAEMDAKAMEEMLRVMAPSDMERARQLRAYRPGSAGAIMITDFLSYREELTVAEVLSDLREQGARYSDFDVQYAYIVSRQGTLRGILRIRDLLISDPAKRLADIMMRNPFHVRVDTPLEDLLSVFEERTLLGVPVTDAQAKLVGVVRRGVVMEAAARGTGNTLLKFGGIVGGEELRSAPLVTRCLRRLSFLAPVVLLNLIAVKVLAEHQEVLEAAILLAVFMPVVSGLSGYSGNQSLAVSLRELSLGLIKPREYGRVLSKEIVIGLINGLVLGAALAGISFLWKGDGDLSLVLGVALAINLVLSVLIGGMIPLLLKRWGADPALFSGPLVTAFTDTCGFLLVLTIAKAWLVGP